MNAVVDRPAYFARAFKTSLGKPPHAYLNGVRIERAMALLRDTEASITEIAIRCASTRRRPARGCFAGNAAARPASIAEAAKGSAWSKH
jgi:transcriptional regulator GlxA family with amidase domain